MAKPTLVLVPVWASGHFMPTLEAGKRLVAALGGGFSLTVLVMGPPTRESALEVAAHVAREAAGGVASFHHLPAVEPPTGCTTVEEFTSRYIHLHAPHVKRAVAALPGPAAALVVEFTSTTMFDVARELGVPAYVYFASSAAMLAVMMRLPALHEEVRADFGEMEGQLVHVPGLPPVPASCMPASVMRKSSPSYADTVYHGGRLAGAAGIIVNTAAELEPAVVAVVAEGRCTPGRPAPALYPIGPVIPSPDDSPGDHECLRWLHAQSPASVVFLCFGSMGILGAAQVREAAVGLERSGHRFLLLPPSLSPLSLLHVQKKKRDWRHGGHRKLFRPAHKRRRGRTHALIFFSLSNGYITATLCLQEYTGGSFIRSSHTRRCAPRAHDPLAAATRTHGQLLNGSTHSPHYSS